MTSSKKKSGRSCDRPVFSQKEAFYYRLNNYAARCLRINRIAPAPNGRSNNAPEIIVVGSGIGAGEEIVIESMFAVPEPLPPSPISRPAQATVD